jgi:2-dehydropantoate 2-reductase
MRKEIGLFNLWCGRKVFTCTWLPDCEPRGVILFLHGAESHSGWFEEVALDLEQQKFAVVSFDRPGWGNSEGERGHLASRAEALSQVVEITSHLRERFGSVHLVGLSWGGLLALYVATRRWVLFDSLTLIAPGIYSRSGLPFSQKIRVAAAALIGRKRYVPLPIHTADFTRNLNRTQYIQNDPLRITTVSSSFCIETLKMRWFVHTHLGQRRLSPSMLLLAEADAIINNDATRKLLSRVEMTISLYEHAAHSLVFEDPSRVAADIARVAIAAETTPPGKRIVVMGAGAVGSAVGGLLALRGHGVTLVARKDHVDAVNTKGLEIHLVKARRTIAANLNAVVSPEAISDKVDLVILTVKSFDTEAALEALRPVIGPDTVILSLQNGTDNETQIAREFPDNIILSGVICAYLEFPEPGRIVWSDDRGGLAGAVFLGDVEKGGSLWNQILPDTGLGAPFFRGPRAPESVKWSKLMLNVAFNALNAVTALPTAEIFHDKRYGIIAARALQEGFRVMRRLGIQPVDLPGYPVRGLAALSRLPDALLRSILSRILRKQQTGRSSLAQDLARGRVSTEVDAINGAIVRAGATCGVPTPANRLLCEMVKKATNDRLAKSTDLYKGA